MVAEHSEEEFVYQLEKVTITLADKTVHIKEQVKHPYSVE